MEDRSPGSIQHSFMAHGGVRIASGGGWPAKKKTLRGRKERNKLRDGRRSGNTRVDG